VTKRGYSHFTVWVARRNTTAQQEHSNATRSNFLWPAEKQYQKRTEERSRDLTASQW